MGAKGRKAIAAGAMGLGIGLLMGSLLIGRGTETLTPESVPAPAPIAAPSPLPSESSSPPPLPPMPEAPLPDGVPNLAGVVVDQAGQPVAGAEVTAYVADLGAERIRSGEDGAFAFYGLDEGQYRVSAVADGFNTAVIESAPFGSLALTLVLEPLSAAEGVVLDAETREPIAEFDVTYLDAPPDGEAHWQRLVAANRPAWRALTEPSGVFRLDSLASGVPFAVAARAKGRQPAYIDVGVLQPGEEATDLVFYLKAAARLEGTVKNPRGEPIVGANIHLGPEQDDGAILATSRADGTFVIENLSGDSIELTAIHPNARPDIVTALLMPGRTARVEFVLDSGAGVEGYVTRGGEPLAGAQVLATEPKRRIGEIESGVDGYYRLEGLPAGQLLITAVLATDSGSRLMVTRELSDGALERFDFDFPSGAATIEGFVTRDGQPAADVTIRAVLNYPNAPAPFTVYAKTDDDGYYLLEGLGAGVVTVFVRNEDASQTAAVSVVDGDRVRQDFILGTGAALSGTVSGLFEGQAANIALLPPDTVIEEPMVLLSDEWLALMSRSSGGVSTETGPYTLQGVQPGAYLAVAIAFNPEGALGVSVTDSVRIAQQRIEIREGERLTIDFNFGP